MSGHFISSLVKQKPTKFVILLVGIFYIPSLYADDFSESSTQISAVKSRTLKPYRGTTIQWANTFRYNWGMRMSERDSRIADHALFDQGDALFDRYDINTNRIDWFSELDIHFPGRYGARLTAAAWYDEAYGTYGKSNPDALGGHIFPDSYENGEFSSYVKRYYAGPSAELLDAFVFGAFDVGVTVWNVKLGRHAVVWGESLFGNTNAVSYSQVPNDGMKGITNPGASAKETALPLSQFSVLAQLTPELSVVGQYSAEWRASRLPEGGTYFGLDVANQGPNVNRLSSLDGEKGDLGLGLIWRSRMLDSTVAIYHRQFDDKTGWLAQPTGGGQTRAVYAKDISLQGVSLAKNIGGASLGAELSHRRHMPLVSSGSMPSDRYEGAKGETWHSVINALVSIGPSPWYDSAILLSEVNWSRLDKVTDNSELFRAQRYQAACDTNGTIQGCADNEAFGLSVAFTPTWFQVFPGVNIEMPVFISKNIHGNAATNAGGSEGFTLYKIGLTAKVFVRHKLGVAYTGYDQKIQSAPDSVFGSRLLGPPYKDKDWLSFTYSVVF
ncbi:DUF1302 domain-containing protein [Teredinibacter haidensis]|uniref:DUF1302 domain-containing protein n=1 Tax=Teredinibacter haidensis TaxID=2731755 RepID=UPI0009488BC1|nr:DUF1302 family protein [Teredinibacter haidensis]